MQPSSRTPEGDDNTCHICGHVVRIAPSRPPGDAPCPHCGALLWFADDMIDPVRVRQAARLSQRADAAIQADRLSIARRLLQRALSFVPANSILRRTLAGVESRLMEQRPRKRSRHGRQRAD